MKEISGMDHIIGTKFKDGIDYIAKGFVKVSLTLIDPIFVCDVKIAKT